MHALKAVRAVETLHLCRVRPRARKVGRPAQRACAAGSPTVSGASAEAPAAARPDEVRRFEQTEPSES